MIENIVNILLVEDEEAHAELFRRAFAARAPQVHVTVAGSIQEAQACLSQRRPDLMITDIVLPDGKGTDLLPADKRFPPFPVVVITSHGNEQMAVDAMRAGAVNYITKSDTALANMPEVAEQALREWQQLVREKELQETRRRANEELERLVKQRTTELEEANAGLKEKILQRERAERELRDNQAQLLAAQRIQACLLPGTPPELPGFDIAGASYPAEFTAGDYFDYLTMSDESIGLVIADVSGHGFAPSLLMASTHALLQSLAHTHCDVGPILMQANRFLTRETELDRFVTLLLARLDPASRSFVYASAGHTPGFLLDRTGNVKRRLESTSLPLAVMPDIEFPTCDPIGLESGDMILLLTDGFHEAESAEGEYFGFERALDIIRANRHERAAEIVETLYHAACDFTSPEKPADDLTAMVVKVE